MFNRVKKNITQLCTDFQTDSLLRNSLYLFLATVVLAGFGFLFWLINAHLYSISEIGLATTLISVMNLIALISLIGFDSVFVRFLPTSNYKNEKMNTGLLLVGIASILLSIGFLLSVNIVSPKLSFIVNNPAYEIIFIASCLMNAINVLTDSVFLAGRKTVFILVINILLCFIKIIAPFALISYGTMGIFIAAALAQTFGTLLSIGVMIWKFDYRPQLKINKNILKLVWRYSSTNYVSGFLNLVPPTILPILITNFVSAAASAYYYIVMMIGNLLYSIPMSVTRSLFAEGSHDETSLETGVRKSTRVIALLLVPAIIVLLLVGKFVLRIFGENYADGGAVFLYLVAITGIFVSVNSIFFSIFKVRKQLKTIIFSNTFYSFAILVSSVLLLPWGLTGIGIAWLGGSILASAFNFALYARQPQ